MALVSNSRQQDCAKALRILLNKLVIALSADIDTLYDDAIAKGLVGERSVAPDKPGRARNFLDAIIARVEIDTVTNPYEKFIAILRSKRNLSYLADMIEEQREKEPEDQSTKNKKGNASGYYYSLII